MNLSEIIQPGLSKEETFVVDERHLAQHLGSGSLRVLATPSMIALMEHEAHLLLEQRLPKGYSSVGTLVNVRHLAPTPLGSRFRVRVEVIRVEENRISFHVQAWDEKEQIGDGEHQRVVIDYARFLRRVASKNPEQTQT